MTIPATTGDPGPKYKELSDRLDRTAYDHETGATYTYVGPLEALGAMQSDCQHEWSRVDWAAHPDGGLYQCNLCHDCLSIADYQRMRNQQDAKS